MKVRGWRAISLATVLIWTVAIPTRAAAAVLPVPGGVARAFDPPAQAWSAGHRGVDLPASVGAPVRAALGGRVGYAGDVAGKPVVTVVHGGLRTTYEPVVARVAVGETVSEGEVIGVLAEGHPCPGGSCLHWGLKQGDVYLDPMLLIEPPVVRLLPDEAVALARARAAERR